MLKLDYILSPKFNLGCFTKNLLMIDYENSALTTSEWKYGDEDTSPISSDLKIQHLDYPKKCDINLVSDKLLEIIRLYELNEKIIETCNTRIFLSNYTCNEPSEDELGIDKNLYKFIPGYSDSSSKNSSNSEDTNESDDNLK